ncbi:putative PPE family protein PPE42 [Mycobacterium marinum]|uniref:Putative PPE family protein PPE42 n=1 Tax=Mycobacterium marinum TaxID=1781 RepID=A0A3E2MSC2_MYCMR|nr:PPE family protein [Mycobacterium marinum]RFZ37327.1 putative PPE family protein PPE42 [Mycobacterium marinum]
MLYGLLPPEVNSTRMHTGAGVAPMLAAGAAWEGLAAELSTAATSFGSVTTDLAGGPWQGPASVAMTTAAAPYIAWLTDAAGHAHTAATHAISAANVFETALATTVHPAVVTANRSLLATLVATNLLGQNSPTIAATEAAYEQMWAQDVAAMTAYDSGARSLITALKSEEKTPPPGDVTLPEPIPTTTPKQPAAGGGLMSGLVSQLAKSAMPLTMGLAPVALSAGMSALGPPMSAAAGGAGPLAAAGAGAGAGITGGIAGVAGSQAGTVSAAMGQAHSVRALSVPPTWGVSPTISGASNAVVAATPSTSSGVSAVGAPAGRVGAPMPMGMPMGAAGAAAAGSSSGGGSGGGVAVTSSRPSIIPRIV